MVFNSSCSSLNPLPPRNVEKHICHICGSQCPSSVPKLMTCIVAYSTLSSVLSLLSNFDVAEFFGF